MPGCVFAHPEWRELRSLLRAAARPEQDAVLTTSANDPAGARDQDARQLARVATGDGASLRALYDRHAARAMAVALRVLGAANEAEEIVQETFVEVWRRAREFDPRRGGAGAWIAAIARNRSIDRLRKRGAVARTLQGAADQPVSPPRSPLEDVEQRLERERIGAALAQLPDEQRRALELAFFEGRTHQEIADLTGTPLGTIKTRVRLGMEKLAALLGGTRP
jgi:RNA polymerase sigma-70 factor (ECF subfamily)